MPTYHVHWNDERDHQDLDADEVVLDDGIYEFWRGKDAFLRVPASAIESIDPAPAG